MFNVIFILGFTTLYFAIGLRYALLKVQKEGGFRAMIKTNPAKTKNTYTYSLWTVIVLSYFCFITLSWPSLIKGEAL